MPQEAEGVTLENPSPHPTSQAHFQSHQPHCRQPLSCHVPPFPLLALHLLSQEGRASLFLFRAIFQEQECKNLCGFPGLALHKVERIYHTLPHWGFGLLFWAVGRPLLSPFRLPGASWCSGNVCASKCILMGFAQVGSLLH